MTFQGKGMHPDAETRRGSKEKKSKMILIEKNYHLVFLSLNRTSELSIEGTHAWKYSKYSNKFGVSLA